MAQYFTELPPNIISEILSRLPIKSLLACTSVCKTFLHTISSNPFFNSLHSSKAALHLITQLGDEDNPTSSIHWLDSGLDTAIVLHEEVSFKHMFETPYHPIFEGFLEKEDNFFLVSSCDGLLFFAEKRLFDWRVKVRERSFVCNPITSEYVTLLEFDEEMSQRGVTRGFWFGFSPSENRYKVLRIFSTSTGNPGQIGFKQGVRAEVHVVGSSSWRDVEYHPLSEHLSWDTDSTFSNGTVYWLCQNSKLSKFIIFFDYEQEKFGEILSPLAFGSDWQNSGSCMSIGELAGRLSVTVSAECLVIWSMEKYESWTKQVVVDASTHLRERPLWPLQILSNGHIVMMSFDLELVCCDAEEKTFQNVKFKGVGEVVKSVVLKPSFVPLKDALMIDEMSCDKRFQGKNFHRFSFRVESKSTFSFNSVGVLSI